MSLCTERSVLYQMTRSQDHRMCSVRGSLSEVPFHGVSALREAPEMSKAEEQAIEDRSLTEEYLPPTQSRIRTCCPCYAISSQLLRWSIWRQNAFLSVLHLLAASRNHLRAVMGFVIVPGWVKVFGGDHNSVDEGEKVFQGLGDMGASMSNQSGF